MAAYRRVEAGWAVQRRRAFPRRRKRRHIDVAPNISSQPTRLPPPYADVVAGVGARLAQRVAERRKRLRHGKEVLQEQYTANLKRSEASTQR